MKINSFEEGCQLRGYDPIRVIPDVSQLPEKFQRSTVAFIKLGIISEASWEGKEPDWNDSDQFKWTGWWDMEVDENNPSGFRLGGSDCDGATAYSGGGSRLCFPSKEDFLFHAEKFIDLFRDMMVISK